MLMLQIMFILLPEVIGFMKSNFAKQQKSAFSENNESPITPPTNVIW